MVVEVSETIQRNRLLKLGVDYFIEIHAARCLALFDSRLRISYTLASCSGLDDVRVLLFENGELFFGFPIEPRVGSKKKIHFFQRTLVGFGVEGPNDRYGEGVANAEDIKSLFSDVLKHNGAKKNLPIH